MQLSPVFDTFVPPVNQGIQKMIEPRRSRELLFHNVARVLTYVAFAAIGAAAVFIFVMVLKHH